jgi:hypothetical protein
MSERPIAELFDIPNRFLRSAHLERDFSDPRALEGYILTDPTRQALNRIVAGLRPDSGQRAWRITGDYGTGKSSFGLLLAHVLAGRQKKLPQALRQAVDFSKIGLAKKMPRLYPLLITGARESLTSALGRAILGAIESLREGKRAPIPLRRIKDALDGEKYAESIILRALADLSAYLVENDVASGLVLILDELGKFLEHCALNSSSDVYTLQRLAETAARSGDRPLVVVGLLHQGFHVYAEQLPGIAQQEWQKVAGRFEEVVFDQPLEHTSLLVSGALNVRLDKVPAHTSKAAQKSMDLAVGRRWYGNGVDERALKSRAVALYPLHPFVLPPLVRFLRRYGQHERSLFGFLLSSEPFGLQDFATRASGPSTWYRLHNLYDYVRANFGHLLGGQSHRSHWLRLSSMIDGQRGDDEWALRVLKTVGILNLIDAEDLAATSEVIECALDAAEREDAALVQNAITRLKGQNLLYYRGVLGGFCLWPHTSVSLEQAYKDAERAHVQDDCVSSRIVAHLDSRPLVARRHHITTGTLRHFEVSFVSVGDLSEAVLVVPEEADGLVLVPLCDTPAEHLRALEFVQASAAASRPDILFAVPEPLRNLSNTVRHVECWDWVVKNTPALTHDSFAAEEAARGRSAAQRALRHKVDNLVGLRGPSPAASLRWFHRGEAVTVPDGRQLMERLSDICDELFVKAPRITNELVNRRSLSSAGVRGRQQLVEHIVVSAHLPALGLDTERAPPERSIYLSVMALGGMHRMVEGAYTIVEPSPERDACNLLPTFARIRELLTAQSDARVNIETIAAELRKSPYGVRDGVWPLLLTIYIKAHEHELAFYENGAYLVQIGGAELQLLMKAPETFEMQLCQVVGVRAEVFDRLLTLLDVSGPVDRKPALLDIVTPLCSFAAHLPEYVRKTSVLSAEARAVRAALLDAEEPVKLLFQDLPRACGEQPFSPGDPVDDLRVQGFVRALRSAQNELRDAYASLQRRNEVALHEAMGVSGDGAEARAKLSARALRALIAVRETRLRAFCLRLQDDALPTDRWMEAIASFVRSKPPSRWTDADERLYIDEISALGETFQRVEAVAFVKGKEPATNGHSAVRVLLTRGDGTEVAQVLDVADVDESEVARIEGAISKILKGSDRLGLAATSRAIWKALSQRDLV